MNSVLNTLKTNVLVQVALLSVLAYVIYMYKDNISGMFKANFRNLKMTNVNTGSAPVPSAPVSSVTTKEGLDNTSSGSATTSSGSASTSSGVSAYNTPSSSVPMDGDLAAFDISATEKQALESIASGASQLVLGDLLPKYDTSTTSTDAVTTVLQNQNQLINGFAQGNDTISSSKRIPYNDFRENILIPKDDTISPWNISPFDESSQQRGV
jgi:hypothetical protein